jgi:hypothetical protein
MSEASFAELSSIDRIDLDSRPFPGRCRLGAHFRRARPTRRRALYASARLPGSALISAYHSDLDDRPIEDTLAVLHLITHGIPSRFPA